MERPVLLLTSVAPAANGTHEADRGGGNDRVTFDPDLDPTNFREVENVS